MPASVIGPVNGPRSASTSLNARVAGLRRAARGSARAEVEPACVSLRCGLAISGSYRLPITDLRLQDIIRN